MLSCKDATRLHNESLETPLPLMRRLSLRMHVMLCRLCRRNLKQVKAIEEIARRYILRLAEDDAAEGPSLTDEARERMKESLRGS